MTVPDKQTLMDQAAEAVRHADWETALSHYGMLLKHYPEHCDAYLGYGNCLLHLERDFDEAERVFRDAQHRFPDIRQAAERVAHVTRRKGRLNKALQLYDALRKRFPEYPTATIGYTDILTATGKADEAESVLKEFIKNHPDFYAPYGALINIVSSQNRNEEFLALARDAKNRFPDIPSMHNAEARALVCLRRYGEADEVYRNVNALAPTSSVGLVGLLWVATLQEDLAEAEKHYAAVRRQFPDNLQGPMFYARMFYNLQFLKQADAILEELIAAFPNQIAPLLLSAQVAEKSDADQLVLERYQLAAQLFPQNYQAQSGYGKALLRQGREQQAKQHYQDLMHRFPMRPGPYLHFARLEILAGNDDAAYECMKNLDTRFSDGYPGRLVSGILAPSRGDFDHEETLFTAWAERFPQRIDLHLGFVRMMA